MRRIGVIRHFKVDCPKPALWMSSAHFSKWVRQYDEADIFPMEVKGLATDWEHCMTSDLPRAVQTAKQISHCPTTETSLLREVPLSPFIQTSLRLPHLLWNIGGRVAWLRSHHSQQESLEATKERATVLISQLEKMKQKRILIVSHGFFLIVLAKQLKENGYTGKRKRKYKNGEIHIFEK